MILFFCWVKLCCICHLLYNVQLDIIHSLIVPRNIKEKFNKTYFMECFYLKDTQIFYPLDPYKKIQNRKC